METEQERLKRQREQAATARAVKAENVSKRRRISQTVSMSISKETMVSLNAEAERREVTTHDLIREILDDFVVKNRLRKRTSITWGEK